MKARRQLCDDDVLAPVGLIAQVHDVAGQPHLGALRVAHDHEARAHGAAVAGEPAGAQAQILAELHDEGAVLHHLSHARAGGRQQPAVRAHAVSTAVLERLDGPRRLRVLGTGRGALHLDLDGFVVSVTARGVPMMANAVVAAAPEAPAAVAWDPAAPPAWDPVVRPPGWDRAAVAELARWLAGRVAVPDVRLAAAAGRLLGRGPGLTPEGDDVLAGAAAAIRALGRSAGLPPGRIDAIVGDLVPAGLPRRTGALSATLLRLAASGAAPEPAHRLLAGPPGGREAALADLARLGSGTGRALAAGIALASLHLAGLTGGRMGEG